MDPVTTITLISSGLKLVDQFREMVIRLRGSAPTPPHGKAEQSGSALEISHGASVSRVEAKTLHLDQWDSVRYDALLVLSFGGPEGPDDVMPFLENVLRGRNVPRERMLGVAKHYEMFGGVSPINGQNRKLIASVNKELEARGPRLPIYFGNRNWQPMLADTLRKMRDDGVKSALAFVTSTWPKVLREASPVK